MKEKIYNFIKEHNALVLCGAAIVAMIVVLVLVLSLRGSESAQEDISWGEGLTESIPRFEGSNEERIESGDSFVAAYYNNVTSEQVEEYTSLIESECGITFSSDKYPRSAVDEGRVIVIHYSLTEMKLSVTVTKTA